MSMWRGGTNQPAPFGCVLLEIIVIIVLGLAGKASWPGQLMLVVAVGVVSWVELICCYFTFVLLFGGYCFFSALKDAFPKLTMRLCNDDVYAVLVASD